MSSPEPSSPSINDNRSSILAAIERRSAQPQQSAAEGSSAAPFSTPIYADFDKDHTKRQEFRRLVDPGITRPNSRETALNALKTLLQLADNILQHPEEQKYQKFKPTNSVIKARIIDPKGTLEYAIALGFRPEVDKFQPFYAWHKKYLPDLRIGFAVLKEVVQREEIKEERLERARLEEKAAAGAQIEKVKQAFLDDRKSKMVEDERERQRRAARGSSPIQETVTPPPPYIPGSGIALSGARHDILTGDIGMDDDDTQIS